MTVQKWFENGAYYDLDFQAVIVNSEIVADVREIESLDMKMQDEIGQFITDAINEKLKREAK